MTYNGTEFNDSIEYDYDIDESVTTFMWDELAPAVIVYTVTILLGVTGNLLIIVTIAKYRRMKSITNVFLASLASADLLLILVCTPVKLAKLFSFTWTFGMFLCKTVHYLQNVSAICSVLTLTAMSIERYYAIVHPMKAKYVCTIRQARKIIATTWVASFIFAVPIVFVQVHMEVGSRYKAYWCVRDWSSTYNWRFYEVYMLFVVLIIPASVMVVTYTAICREIRKVAERRLHMTSANGNLTFECYPMTAKRGHGGTIKYKTKFPASDETTIMRPASSYKNEKQVIKMLVAVVVIFILCWAPLLIDNVLTSFAILPPIRAGGVLKHMLTYFHLLAYFNSCVNPVVYGFMSKNFRDSFLKALCCRSKVVRRQLSVSHTRTTSLRTYIN